ncbi:MAG: DUF6580 family putative transport protein [Bacteroidales bacterium]
MEKQKIHIRFGVLALLILLAAFSRLIPHPPNFSPIGAMALFGSAYFSRKHVALLLPILAMWVSDMVINNVVYAQYFERFTFFYQGFYWTYGAFIVIGVIGFYVLKKVHFANVISAALLASVAFFVISNFGVWASGAMYPKSLSGLAACYTAGIPFFKNTILGDLVYSGILFGAFELVQYKYPALKLRTI